MNSLDLLDIENIKKIIKKQRPDSLYSMSKFAVMIPLIKVNNELVVLFELRAKDLKTQPGEVSFPGGRLEKGESFKKAAIRETMEELNIERKNIEIINELDYLISYSNMKIHSFLGYISGVNVDSLLPNIEEVDHLFTVPLKFFLENEPNGYYLDLEIKYNKEFPYNLIPNGENYSFDKPKRAIYFYNYNDYIIWGFTASIMKSFIDKLKKYRLS